MNPTRSLEGKSPRRSNTESGLEARGRSEDSGVDGKRRGGGGGGGRTATWPSRGSGPSTPSDSWAERVLAALHAARGRPCSLCETRAPRAHGRETGSLGAAGSRWKGDGMECFKPAAGMRRGKFQLVHQNWPVGVTGPPWSASEVRLGQIKGSAPCPAGEARDGTHYSKMWSRLEI